MIFIFHIFFDCATSKSSAVVANKNWRVFLRDFEETCGNTMPSLFKRVTKMQSRIHCEPELCCRCERTDIGCDKVGKEFDYRDASGIKNYIKLIKRVFHSSNVLSIVSITFGE